MIRSNKIFDKTRDCLCWVGLFFFICSSGCTATRMQTSHERSPQSTETRAEALGAMQNVAQAMTGKDITRAEIAELARDMENNGEARTAVGAITNSIQGGGAGYKYCPVDGQRYHPKFKICPVHGVPLKAIED